MIKKECRTMRSISEDEISSSVNEMVGLIYKNHGDAYLAGYLTTMFTEVLNRCDEDTRNSMYVRVVSKIVSLRKNVPETA